MNIKKIAASFLAAVMVTSSLATGAFADSFGVAEGTLDEETGLLYVPLEDGTLKVTCPQGSVPTGDIVIPETFGEGENAKTVTEVDGNFLTSFQHITSISIPKTVTTIESHSYAHNGGGLESISVDADNTEFSAVDGVLFDKEQTRLIKYPAKKSGTSYTIPSTVTHVNMFSFAGSEIASVTIPNSVKELGDNAFCACKNLNELYIPDSVNRIGSGLAMGSGITEYTVAPAHNYFVAVDGVLFTVDRKTLLSYPSANAAQEYTVPEGTEVIGYHAFGNSENLTKVTLPTSVASVGSYAFFECYGLISAEIPDNVTELRGTFLSCVSLETVTLPLSITKIGGQTFDKCKSLKTINYAGTKEDWDKIEIDPVANDSLNNATIYFSDGTMGGTDISDVVQKPDVTVNDDGSKNFTPGVKQDITTTDVDIETMKAITASAPADAFDDDVVLNVSHDSFPSAGSSSFAVDISFEKADGTKVQPAKPVTVKIPVPESLKNSDPIFVYHINENGKAEKVEAQTETIGDVKFMVFTATHFSTYVLSEDSTVADDTTGSGSTGGSGSGSGSTSSSTSSAPATSDTTSSDTSSEPASSTPGYTESETSTPGNSSSAPTTLESNPSTGVALSVLPIVAAISAVILIKKRK